MILAIDSGNSRIKWGVHDGEQWLGAGEVERHDIESLERAWQALAAPEQIIACNVAGDIAQARLARMLWRWSIAPVWCESRELQCGVSNGYEEPGQLGPDRWAALIGAWRLYPCASLVVNCGTALTVDALSGNGEFLGGTIAPGFELMLQSLAQNTAGLKTTGGVFQHLPGTTANAIHTGAIAAALGAIEHVTKAMRAAGHTPRHCVLSGGNAALLKPHLSLEVKEVSRLVLEGLIAIASEKR